MTPDQRADVVEKAAAGRKKSAVWADSIARGRYRAAGASEAEIESLMSMPQRDRKWARKRAVLYGLDPLSAAALWQAQDGLCALCSEPLPSNCHVDHDHDSGRVRGLLCPRCNLALGHIEARGETWLARARAYITMPGPERG